MDNPKFENPKKNAQGRPNAYYERILPNMDKIVEQLRGGATEKQVAYNIGVTPSVWKKYKREQKYFRDKCFHAREPLVEQLRGAIITRALGFEYTEKEVTEKATEKGTETVTKTMYKRALPDVAALNLALKNYDKNNWANDPALLAIKKEELKLKQKEAENNW